VICSSHYLPEAESCNCTVNNTCEFNYVLLNNKTEKEKRGLNKIDEHEGKGTYSVVQTRLKVVVFIGIAQDQTQGLKEKYLKKKKKTLKVLPVRQHAQNNVLYFYTVLVTG
jgi:hypothetical protein